MSKQQTIAMTMGDAGGVGPELIAKVLSDRSHREARVLVVGDGSVLRRAATLVPGPPKFEDATPAQVTDWDSHSIPVVAPHPLEVADVPWGTSDVRSGAAAGACLTYAFKLAEQAIVDGVVSAPMCKQTFHAAGFTHIDELAYLAELTESPEPLLVGVADGVWTAAVTLHTPLRAVADLVTHRRVLSHIHALHDALLNATGETPALAVAGLNPHAGDGGLLGHEEIDEISPAVAAAREAGVNVSGPIAADTIFVRAFAGEFQGVVCMYHDQANIARKLRSFASGATLFLGLPVVVGTTAHGTAFDLAGQGIADPGSLHRALELVESLTKERL